MPLSRARNRRADRRALPIIAGLLISVIVAYFSIANAHADINIKLTVDRYTQGKFGRNFGGNGSHRKVFATFESDGRHMLVHARSFDIDFFGEVIVRLNGNRIGELPQTSNRATSSPGLWLIPASIQKTGTNRIEFVQRENDPSWGIQDIGLFAVGSENSGFGNWARKTGVSAKNGITLYLPSGFDDSQLSLRFYDVDNPREVLVQVSSGGQTIPPNTSNNGWGGSIVIDVPANSDSVNIRNLAASGTGNTWGVRIDGFYHAFPASDISGFESLTRAEWDTAAIRRVLHTFAYGGRASEAQVTRWAAMLPQHAITEMLNFDEHNLKLSPVAASDTDAVERQPGTLRALTQYWSRNDRNNPVPRGNRDLYRPEWSLGFSWAQMASAHGLNPFRQKIGLWETNYHMAVNMNAGVEAHQIVHYYDNIMEQLENNTPYNRVLADAAATAAIATQYNHGDSEWDRETGNCECNEDFAREYHQLFFGILGRYERAYHETVSIKNMSRVLTDIRVHWDQRTNRLDSRPTFGRRYHHVAPLEIQHVAVSGNNAREKITELSAYSIEHPESLENLPVMIISGLADDNLTPAKIGAIRRAWGSMRPKNLLGFLRAYAISHTFHSADRFKYWSSIDRSMIFANQYYSNNRESYFDTYSVNSYQRDQVSVFRPSHNVFGNQTGLEASRSPDIVRRAINRATEDLWFYTRPNLEADGQKLRKNWTSVIPRSANGRYRVKDVAEWLWNQYIGDDLKNFSAVARAHVYALLGHDHDLLLALDDKNIRRVVRERDVQNDARIRALVAQLAQSGISLDSKNKSIAEEAHTRLGRAIAFISATPFSFAQQGL